MPLKIGQKAAIVPFGDKIMVQLVPDNPEEKLAELTEGFEFSRKPAKKHQNSYFLKPETRMPAHLLIAESLAARAIPFP